MVLPTLPVHDPQHEYLQIFDHVYNRLSVLSKRLQHSSYLQEFYKVNASHVLPEALSILQIPLDKYLFIELGTQRVMTYGALLTSDTWDMNATCNSVPYAKIKNFYSDCNYYS